MAANINSRVENEQLELNDSIEKAKHVWSKNGKTISLVLGVLIVAIGGFFAYRQFITKPKEAEALDKSFKAEEVLSHGFCKSCIKWRWC